MALLGFGSPYDDKMTSLLGIDPSAARQQALWNGIAQMGAALMGTRNMGLVGGAFLNGINKGKEDYLSSAYDAYRIKTAADDKAYSRAQDAEAKRRQARIDAQNNTIFEHQMDGWQQEEDRRAAAEQAWNNFRTAPTTGVPVQNYNMADALWKMGKTDAAIDYVTPKTPEPMKPTSDMQEYGLALQQGYNGTFQQYMTEMKKAGSTQVNVNSGASGKDIYATAKEKSEAAQAASRGLTSLNQAEQAIQGKGGVITGAGAEARLALQKTAAYLGVADEDALNSIVNTETFRAAIAPQVAAMLKATTGSTQVSNADREFAEKAAAGDISLDEKSILRLIHIMQAANSSIVRDWNSKLDQVYPDGQDFGRERAMLGVPNVPQRYASPIGPETPYYHQQPSVENMSDEELRNWLNSGSN